MKKNLKKAIAFAGALALTLTLTACGTDTETNSATTGEITQIVKVGVVGEYNAQWDTINELLKSENIQVELVKFTDYAAPNRALNDGEIELNAFQHKAFLANDVEEAGYEIVNIGDTLIAPLSIYNNKDKITSMDDIKDGDKIAIPSDLTNGGRALKLLEEAGLIVCNPEKGVLPTKGDITTYNKKIEIIEAESATLANILPDCTAAIINGGNAFTAGLDPSSDALFTENVNPDENPAVPNLVNIIVAREKDADNEVYKKIVNAYHADETKATIDSEYKGAFICAW